MEHDKTMEYGKTIKQIADELGVSKQAVHQKRKSAKLSTALRPFTSTVNGVVLISVDGEMLIKSAFSDDCVKDVDVNLRVNDRKHSDDSFTVVYGIIDTLKEQLTAKDKQIEDQQQTIRELTSALLAAQQTSQAAQALHAGTIQAQIGDGSKPGIFSRIFGGRRNNRNASGKIDVD